MLPSLAGAWRRAAPLHQCGPITSEFCSSRLYDISCKLPLHSVVTTGGAPLPPGLSHPSPSKCHPVIHRLLPLYLPGALQHLSSSWQGPCRWITPESSSSASTAVRTASTLPPTTVYQGPSPPSPKRVTLRTLRSKYDSGIPISMATAYDYPSAVHVRVWVGR